MSSDDKIQLAKQQQSQGNALAAKALYQEVLQQQPDHAEALHFLALIEFDEGKEKSAIAMMQRCCQLQPENVVYKINLARAHCRLQQGQQALNLIQQVLQLVPDCRDALQLYIKIKQATWQPHEVLKTEAVLAFNGKNYSLATAKLKEALAAIDQEIEKAKRGLLGMGVKYPPKKS